MKPETRAALDLINRRFYSRHGAEFALRRRRPWPGWERLAPLLGDAPSILDAGCGNGRFARFLVERLPGPIRYLGLDASRELLEIAEEWTSEALAPDREDEVAFVPGNLLDGGALSGAVPGSFDLVAAFGLMHHVPGGASRRVLLRRLAGRVAPGGLLAVSFWQFGTRRRFTGRSLPIESWAARTGEAIDVGDLEPGDHLLVWGDLPGGPDSIRYCHYVDPDEAERLTEALGLDPVATYLADGATGDLNLYRLFRRPGPEAPRGGRSRQEGTPSPGP